MVEEHTLYLPFMGSAVVLMQLRIKKGKRWTEEIEVHRESPPRLLKY